jgi:biopolymer transport protein ExbD
MSSMTDIIFLLLIFFMITSTLVAPNAIKVNLPQSKKQTTTQSSARIVIDASRRIYASVDGTKEKEVSLARLSEVLRSMKADSTERYVSLYADESVPYADIVAVLNVANEHHLKMVLATRPPQP